MLPPEALEGAFGEGATMLHVLLLLLALIVEDIDLGEAGRAREGGRANRVRGWRWLAVQVGCLTCGEFVRSSRRNHAEAVYRCV